MHPRPGPGTHLGLVPLRGGERLRRLGLRGAADPGRGLRPHLVGPRPCPPHDRVGLPLGVPPSVRRHAGGLFTDAPRLGLDLLQQGQRRRQLGGQLGGAVRRDTPGRRPARRADRTEPQQEIPESGHELSPWSWFAAP
ncbi:hypothetical protein ACWDSL_01760 [Streptomyces sp. NPDC000941]